MNNIRSLAKLKWVCFIDLQWEWYMKLRSQLAHFIIQDRYFILRTKSNEDIWSPCLNPLLALSRWRGLPLTSKKTKWKICIYENNLHKTRRKPKSEHHLFYEALIYSIICLFQINFHQAARREILPEIVANQILT